MVPDAFPRFSALLIIYSWEARTRGAGADEMNTTENSLAGHNFKTLLGIGRTPGSLDPANGILQRNQRLSSPR
jgi:hypothetical protein